MIITPASDTRIPTVIKNFKKYQTITMQITKIQATNMDMTDAIRDYAQGKMAKLENKLQRFGESVNVAIEVSRTTNHHHKGDVFRCEIHLMLPGKTIQADDIQDDLYKAIVSARDKADRMIVDYKETLEAKRRSEDEMEPPVVESTEDGV